MPRRSSPALRNLHHRKITAAIKHLRIGRPGEADRNQRPAMDVAFRVTAINHEGQPLAVRRQSERALCFEKRIVGLADIAQRKQIAACYRADGRVPRLARRNEILATGQRGPAGEQKAEEAKQQARPVPTKSVGVIAYHALVTPTPR
jgi:hypothetical protein